MPALLPTLRRRRSASLPRRIEITQVRRRLALAARHQEAIGAQVVDLAADPDQRGPLDAIGLDPVEMRLRLAQISLVDGPRPRQRIVDHGDLVMQDIRIGLVEIDALLEDRLVVEVQRQAGRVVGAASLERAARLSFEHVEAAVTIEVDPLADRITRKAWLHRFSPT